MTEKGLTHRDTSSRSHIYKAAIQEAKAKNSMLDRFIDKTFKGSASQLVMHVLGHEHTSTEEIEKIKAIISNYENR